MKTTLMANAKEKQLYTLAEQVVEEGTALHHYHNSYDYGRVAGLMVNVKQYDFFSRTDLEALVETSNIPKKYHAPILEEFDSKRIDNTYHHVIEMERLYLRDWLDGCAFDSRDFIENELIPGFFRTGTTPHPHLNEILKRKRTVKTQSQAIRDFFEEDNQLHEALQECLEGGASQFCGRSGGWFLFADSCHDMVDNAQWLQEEFFDGPSKIKLAQGHWETRAQWTAEVEDSEASCDELYDCLKTIRARALVATRLQGMSRDFNMATATEDQLLQDITAYLYDEYGYDEGIKWDTEEIVQAWIQGAKRFPRTAQTTYLRRWEDTVQTSKAVRIPLSMAETLYHQLMDGSCPETIKGYHIQNWDGKRLKAGCHSIAIEEIQRFATLMGWSEAAKKTLKTAG